MEHSDSTGSYSLGSNKQKKALAFGLFLNMSNDSIKANILSVCLLIIFYSPLQLLDRHGDLEVMSQHMESGEDVCPLDHLSQGTPLEDLGAENISRLFCQEAHMDENLKEGRGEGCIMWLQEKMNADRMKDITRGKAVFPLNGMLYMFCVFLGPP